jgi:subtilisin family serine protease
MKKLSGYGLLLSLVGLMSGSLSAEARSKSELNKFNLHLPHTANELIVKFKPSTSVGTQSTFVTQLGAMQVAAFGSSKAVLLSFPAEIMANGNSLLEKAKQLAADPRVEYVEANTILHINKVPNDPKFGELYGLKNTGSTGGTAGADIRATEAWEQATGSMNTLVGIIDTGIDYSHPDIKPNYWNNPGEVGVDEQGNNKATNGVDDDANGYVDDWRGWNFVKNTNNPMDDNQHGTHCAGTIGARGDDGVGVVGVNWQVSMVGIKFLDGAGSGTLANAVKAIEYATKIGVTLTSNSWGGGGFSETMEAAIREANSKGILFIAAAGNDSSNNDRTPAYPASYKLDNVISVGATDHNDRIASFSNWGLNTVHLSAPGVNILSTVPGGAYSKLSGTSMATPHVAGAAALVKSAFPDLNFAGVKARLLANSDKIASMKGKVITGGRLNINNALEVDTLAPSSPAAMSIVESGLNSIKLSWNQSGDDDAVGQAYAYELRYSATPISTEAEWNAATAAGTVLGGTEGATTVEGNLTGLPFNFQGFAAVRALDNVGNVSPVSESVAVQVRKLQVVMENNGESLDGITTTGTWGQSEVAGRGKVFDDSPNGNYRDSTETSLLFAPLSVTSNDIILSFSTAFDFESGYDHGTVEVSSDNGTTWKIAKSFTGKKEWGTEIVDLKPFITKGSTELSIRFKVKADTSITRDGWKFDDVQILAPQDAPAL